MKELVLRNFYGNVCQYTVLVQTEGGASLEVRYAIVSAESIERSTIVMDDANVADVTRVVLCSAGGDWEGLRSHMRAHLSPDFKRPGYVAELPIHLGVAAQNPTVPPVCLMRFTCGRVEMAMIDQPPVEAIETRLRVPFTVRFVDHARVCGICKREFGVEATDEFVLHLLGKRVRECGVVNRESVMAYVKEISGKE